MILIFDIMWWWLMLIGFMLWLCDIVFKMLVVDELLCMVWLYVEVGVLKLVMDWIFLFVEVFVVYVWMEVGDYVGKIVLMMV